MPCALCFVGADELCAYHHHSGGEDWAASNRIFCALLHRGIEPVRLSEHDRDDGYHYD